MDNKICTKSGCIPFQEYVMPLTNPDTDKCRLASTIINVMLNALEANRGGSEDDQMEHYHDCEIPARKSGEQILELMGCVKKED